jgi:hypothetical protein
MPWVPPSEYWELVRTKRELSDTYHAFKRFLATTELTKELRETEKNLNDFIHDKDAELTNRIKQLIEENDEPDQNRKTQTQNVDNKEER